MIDIALEKVDKPLHTGLYFSSKNPVFLVESEKKYFSYFRTDIKFTHDFTTLQDLFELEARVQDAKSTLQQ